MPLKDYTRLAGTNFSKAIEQEVPQKCGTKKIVKSRGELTPSDYRKIYEKKVRDAGIRFFDGDAKKEVKAIERILKEVTPEELLNIFDYIVSEEQNLVPREQIGLFLIYSGWSKRVATQALAWKEGRTLTKAEPKKPPREYKGTGKGTIIIS